MDHAPEWVKSDPPRATRMPGPWLRSCDNSARSTHAGTVLFVQVENQLGLPGSDPDGSAEATLAFGGNEPEKRNVDSSEYIGAVAQAGQAEYP